MPEINFKAFQTHKIIEESHADKKKVRKWIKYPQILKNGIEKVQKRERPSQTVKNDNKDEKIVKDRQNQSKTVKIMKKQ